MTLRLHNLAPILVIAAVALGLPLHWCCCTTAGTTCGMSTRVHGAPAEATPHARAGGCRIAPDGTRACSGSLPPASHADTDADTDQPAESPDHDCPCAPLVTAPTQPDARPAVAPGGSYPHPSPAATLPLAPLQHLPATFSDPAGTPADERPRARSAPTLLALAAMLTT